jgi:hypothetical protein
MSRDILVRFHDHLILYASFFDRDHFCGKRGHVRRHLRAAGRLASGLLLRSQNRVLGRLGDSEFDDRLGWNLDLLLCLWVDAGTRFPLLLYQLAKAGEHEFAFLLDRFISEAAERIQENSGRSFVRLSRCGERNLMFGLSHAAVSYGSGIVAFQEDRR